MKCKLLIAGGAGYIGSHMVSRLSRLGNRVVVLDNLSSGYQDAVQGQHANIDLIIGDIGDRALLERIFSEHTIDAVFNFASYIQVGESVSKPIEYYTNNVANTLVLLQAMRNHGVKKYIFSSTAAIFGSVNSDFIDERQNLQPTSPYGWSKFMVEQILSDLDQAHGLKSVCLRYFNAAGADPANGLGERHNPETHLIPLVLQVASGRRPCISIFGTDYPTSDGTCVRDYVHVLDLCDAHLLALRHLMNGGDSRQFNLGNGRGFTVFEVIRTVERLTGRKISIDYRPRRAGDPARLVADSSLIRRELGWQPKRSDLETIVADAWAWETKWFGFR